MEYLPYNVNLKHLIIIKYYKFDHIFWLWGKGIPHLYPHTEASLGDYVANY